MQLGSIGVWSGTLRRGEPDTTRQTALLVLGGLILLALVLRLIVPRGIWLDEAISVHQAHLSPAGIVQQLAHGDRHPPLYHLALWATVHSKPSSLSIPAASSATSVSSSTMSARPSAF